MKRPMASDNSKKEMGYMNTVDGVSSNIGSSLPVIGK
jgi:hypothetical protein